MGRPNLSRETRVSDADGDGEFSVNFPVEQDWQPCPVDAHSAIHTYIHACILKNCTYVLLTLLSTGVIFRQDSSTIYYRKALSLSARASPLRVLGFLRRSALRR